MQSPKISVIIPVYNASETIRSCIDSILGQDFTDFEIIAVDDGSSDNSRGLIADLAAKDGRVRLLTPAHGGVSCARNHGIEAAKGEWIAFIDADDSVEPDFLSSLVSNSDGVQLSVCGYNIIEPGQKPKAVNIVDGGLELDAGGCCTIDNLLGCLNAYSLGFVWCKLFRRTILMSGNIRFDPHVTFGEDSIFCFSYYSHVRRCHVSLNNSYNYIRPCDGSSLSLSSPAGLRLTGIEGFWQTVEPVCRCGRAALREKLEIHYLDQVLTVLNKDREAAKPTLSASDRYRCYANIRRRIRRSTYRGRLPVFFDLCGFLHCWNVYELIFKLIYLRRK